MKKLTLKQTVLSLLAVFLTLTTTSCSQKIQEQPREYNPDRMEEIISKKYQRSSSEAIEIIQDFLNKSRLRSSLTTNEIKLDYVLNTEILRASLDEQGIETVDTVLYILNIQGGNGFSVIAGDKRLPDILIASESGSLLKNEEIEDDSGFAVFLSRLPAFYALEIERFENETISSSKETRLLVHCNWGWGGYRDGYFYPGVFDSNNSVNLRSTDVEENTPGYYKHKVKSIVNAYR